MKSSRLAFSLTAIVVCLCLGGFFVYTKKPFTQNTPQQGIVIPASPKTESEQTSKHDPDNGGIVIETINSPGKTIPPQGAGHKPPQFILLSFDGSKSLEMWQQTREFAKKLTQEGKPLQFTYFISGVYFITPETKNTYLPPHQATGTSAIGYAVSKTDIANRIEAINQTIADGNEIASHANGHFNGTTWSKNEWESELTQFTRLTKDAGDLHLPTSGYSGFRAPELGRSDKTDTVLKQLGYLYDASRVGKPEAWPGKLPNGLWSIPLAKIPFATSTSGILSMDYNFYLKQSKAKDMAKKGTPEWQRMYDEMLTSYQQYFEKNYTGTRAPISIGHHFSLWNDGVYWEVMKQFAEDNCGKPEVRCTTFTELVNWLESQPSQ